MIRDNHWVSNLLLFLSGTAVNTLEKSSGIWILKSKFFIYRLVSYFFFLLFPVWAQKSVHLGQGLQIFVMLLYILFMVSQWFFLGKEIDHRLKIYFRINSSIDRVVYRTTLGMIFFVIYFNLLSFLPGKWIYNLFWTTWVILGLFYSWPTRGKIIQESVSTNFSEFRYLDRFEKTLFGLIILMFAVSIPELPSLVNTEALKLFFDPLEKFNTAFWNFLTVNYYPFKKYSTLNKIAWSLHFYTITMGMFLLTFYALLRYFLSRRLSLLGVFALISSWSFTKIMANNYGATITTTYSLLWVWSLMWVTKSSTYRSGLFLGLVAYWGVLINQSFIFLLPIQLLFLNFIFLKEKTFWYKRQTLKYSLLGFALSVLAFFTFDGVFENLQPLGLDIIGQISKIINRKAFFSLAIFGLIIIALKRFRVKFRIIESFKINLQKMDELILLLLVLTFYVFVFDGYLLHSFSLMWIMAFLSLIPLELLFQTISRLRSSRNMIYVIYILICLLDSHFEGRVKIFLRLLN